MKLLKKLMQTLSDDAIIWVDDVLQIYVGYFKPFIDQIKQFILLVEIHPWVIHFQQRLGQQFMKLKSR